MSWPFKKNNLIALFHKFRDLKYKFLNERVIATAYKNSSNRVWWRKLQTVKGLSHKWNTVLFILQMQFKIKRLVEILDTLFVSDILFGHIGF